MLQIKNTLGGGKPEGLYAWKKSLFELGDLQNFNKSLSTLPYYFYSGSAVVLNGELHILGTFYDSLYYKYHYKWDGSSWTKASTLPYNFHHGSAVVLNGEIHILGGSDGYTNHYKWDGSSWTSVSTLPYSFSYGSAVVLNGELHILGGANNTTSHYKWNGSSWTSASTLPYAFAHGSAVVLNGEIHILGSIDSNNYTKHYKFNGDSWTELDLLPYNFYDGSAVTLYGEIHILGGNGNATKHYKWDGSSWTSVSTLPYDFYQGSAVVYNSAIQTLGGYSTTASYTKYHYSISGYSPTYTFLDYIVSDKENAYPDGGEKGGYWYEKVSEGITPEMFGCTKMAVDKFTLSSTLLCNAYSISHSLGTIPKFIFIIAVKKPTAHYNVYQVLSTNPNLNTEISSNIICYYTSGGIYDDTVPIDSITSNQFKVNNPTFKYSADTEYTVITMA